MSDTLLVLWYRPDTKRAALLCTLSNSSLFFLVCGDYTVEQYSKFDLTIALYAFFFVISSPGPKVHVNYCHHLASVVCRV